MLVTEIAQSTSNTRALSGFSGYLLVTYLCIRSTFPPYRTGSKSNVTGTEIDLITIAEITTMRHTISPPSSIGMHLKKAI